MPLKGSPSVPKTAPVGGAPRPGHDTLRLTNLTNERTRTTPSELAERFTNFKCDCQDPMTGPLPGSKA